MFFSLPSFLFSFVASFSFAGGSTILNHTPKADNRSYSYDVNSENATTFRNATSIRSASIGDCPETKEFYFTIAAYDTFTLNLTVHNETDFVIVQTHSHLLFIEMNHGNHSVKGRNAGVILFPKNNSVAVTIRNFNSVMVNTLAFVSAYNKHAPVPGACVPPNKMITPILQLHVYQNIIKVTAFLAVLVQTTNTTEDNIKYKLFYRYSPERDLSSSSYFESLRSMKSVQDMHVNGTEYALPFLRKQNYSLSVNFANYPGIGIIFGLVAETKNSSSIYVLSHTYGCNETVKVDNCFFLVNTFQRVIIVILCACGLFLCYSGHSFLNFEFLMALFLLVGVIAYTCLYNIYIYNDNMIVTTIASIVIGTIIFVVVTLKKIRYVRRMTVFITVGIIISSLIMFCRLGNWYLAKKEEVYWTAFTFMALVTWGLIVPLSYDAHYVSSSVVGSFLFILTIDYFSGCNLKYIIFDNIRRINVEDFFQANISPPFQTPDIILLVLWATMVVSGIMYQFSQDFIKFVRPTDSGLELDFESFDESEDNEFDFIEDSDEGGYELESASNFKPTPSSSSAPEPTPSPRPNSAPASVASPGLADAPEPASSLTPVSEPEPAGEIALKPNTSCGDDECDKPTKIQSGVGIKLTNSHDGLHQAVEEFAVKYLKNSETVIFPGRVDDGDRAI